MSTTKRPREKGPESLTGMTLDEFRERVRAAGLQEYRAQQVFEWVYVHRATEYQEMTNLPKALRAELDRELPVFTSSVDREQVSSDGTVKLLVRLHDGETVETVMIPDGERRTVCLSTQAGCAVGCSFCASGLLGLQRNLTTGEIVEQVLHVRRAMPADERVSNLVFMGVGEPLANYRNLRKAITILNARWGGDIGKRHMTVSTVGLLNGAKRLARDHPQVTLAVSLHAPNDEIRRQIVPMPDAVTVQNLIGGAQEYFEVTGRKPTFEYCLIGDVNCRPEHAAELARRLEGLNCYVNVIPLSPVPEIPLRAPTKAETSAFAEVLREAGIEVAVRRQRGVDVDASCGQLRLRAKSEGAASSD